MKNGQAPKNEKNNSIRIELQTHSRKKIQTLLPTLAQQKRAKSWSVCSRKHKT